MAEEKRPTYNGYTEQYLTGKELKEKFSEKYYCDGRHHSVCYEIKIPHYLSFMKIDDEKKYRIFYNDAFCKVMKDNNDKDVCFFGHTKIERIKLLEKFKDEEIKYICPECKSELELKKGKYGFFFGCVKYPECKYTRKANIIGNLKMFYEE